MGKLNKKRGFTLVELIIVITILVIISSIGIVKIWPMIANSHSFKDESEAKELLQSINFAVNNFKLEGVDMSSLSEETFIAEVKKYTEIPVVTLQENKKRPSDENWIIGTVTTNSQGSEMFLSYDYAFNINQSVQDVMTNTNIAWAPVTLNYDTKFAVATKVADVALTIDLPLFGEAVIPGTNNGSFITKKMLERSGKSFIMKHDYSVIE